MLREYLTEGGRILLNANLIIMVFLIDVGIHVFLNDEIICTPGTNPVGDSFIDCGYDGEQETILEKSVPNNPNPTTYSGHLRLYISIVFVNPDSATIIR